MSEVEKFLDRLQSDPHFAKEVKSSKTASEIIDTAQKHGITLTGPNIAAAMAEASPKLTEEELVSVNTDTVMAAALIK